MGANYVIRIDGRWRSLEALQAEGRRLRFAVLRNGLIKMLSRPPKASNIIAGEPLLYRNKKRLKKISDEKEKVIKKNIRNEKEYVENINKKITNEEIIKTNNIEKENVRIEKDDNIENNNVSHKKENIRNTKISHEKINERKIKETKKEGIFTKNVSNGDNLKISHDLEKVNIPTNVDSSAENTSSSHSEELVIEIDDTDILLMRRFFLKTQIYQVDVKRFDTDKWYRSAILYQFHPVVQVERLQPEVHHQLTPSLRSVSWSSVPPGREYSSLEDHAIVAWLSASRDRECAVNGNSVWREMQPHHARLTGQERSWHSLRNRYLRYILPALGLMALSPSHGQRLRAAAATGKLKNRKKSRPSILHKPAVRTAYTHAHARLRLHPVLTISDDSGEVQTRIVRESLPKRKSSPVTSPEKSTVKKNSQESESGTVKVRKVVCQRKSMNLRTRSPLKRIQMENTKYRSEHNDMNTDGEKLERSRLRPRPLNLSDNSDDDNTYKPSSPQKKRRKLFNPYA